MRVQLIAKPGPGITGTSRYTTELFRGLQAAGLDVRLTFPSPIPIPGPVQAGLRRIGVDANAFLSSYPLDVRLETAAVCHLTGQTLATLLLFKRIPCPVVVTVHDIIPYTVRKDRELNTFRHMFDALFYRLALTGLRRADALIAVSNYTRQTLVEQLGIEANHICVIHEAVDLQRFRPCAVPPDFRQKYHLGDRTRYILYVGSDDPRKNVATLIRAFAIVRKHMPEARLLKAGPAHFGAERQRLLALVSELGLQDSVRFMDHVPDEDLPLLYNTADVFVLPSFYEGFGLPALEAMSCGTPVIVSDRASLPEVVGDGGLLFDPGDVETLARRVGELLKDPGRRASLAEAALRQAACFSSERQAAETMAVYAKIG